MFGVGGNVLNVIKQITIQKALGNKIVVREASPSIPSPPPLSCGPDA